MADHETPESIPTTSNDGSDMDLSPRTNVDGTAVGVKRKRNVVPLNRSGVLARERAQILVLMDVTDRKLLTLETRDILEVEGHAG